MSESKASNLRGVAVVTGGSRGIGRAICERLGRDGFHVIVNFASSESKAKEVVDAIIAHGGSAEMFRADISRSEQVSQMMETAVKAATSRSIPLKVLVNNAGLNIDSLLVRMKDEDLDRILATDLKGAMLCTREAAKTMMRARTGSIIQIASVVGECGNAGQSAYSAAKAGLIGFTKSVAKELASRSIRANVITPGYIATDMTGALTDAQKEAILRTIPLGELGKPEDIASAVSFLASDESRYITGQILGINGGMYM